MLRRTLVIGSDAPRPTLVYGSGCLVGVMSPVSVSCCPVPVVGVSKGAACIVLVSTRNVCTYVALSSYTCIF